MLKEYTCIMCPRGCDIHVELDGIKINKIDGASCSKGVTYVEQEITDPRRNIATSVLVENGELPLVSVRLDKPIPKNKIFDVMQEIKKVKLHAPVKAGQIIIENILGLDSNVIATKNVES